MLGKPVENLRIDGLVEFSRDKFRAAREPLEIIARKRPRMRRMRQTIARHDIRRWIDETFDQFAAVGFEAGAARPVLARAC